MTILMGINGLNNGFGLNNISISNILWKLLLLESYHQNYLTVLGATGINGFNIGLGFEQHFYFQYSLKNDFWYKWVNPYAAGC